MPLFDRSAQVLTQAVAAGAEACAARLAASTRDPWRVDKVELSVHEEGPFAAEHASVASDHYGCHFSFPGGSLLVLFSGKSGYQISTAFTREHHDSVENMAKRESLVLGEVANILLNPLVGRLADMVDETFIISAPQTKIASPRDHLTAALERYRNARPLAAAFFIALTSPQLSDCRVLLFLDEPLAGRIAAAGDVAPP